MQQFVTERSAYQNLGAHIRTIVEETPTLRAITHLVRGEEEGTSLSYGQLDRIARSLGALFQAREAQGERALMLFNAGVESVAAFLGCLYSRVIAVPLPAPLNGPIHRYLPRVEAVVKNAEVKFVLTTSDILQRLQELACKTPAFANVEWIAMDKLPELSADWLEEEVLETDVAYLQYTSGSTSIPKGVMVSHNNLLKICQYDGALLDFSKRDGCAVCWMPYFHDYGLIEGLLVPIFYGLPVYIMSPLDFVANPVRWLNAIHRYRATNSSGPNFAFELCVRKTTPAQRQALDLRCWRTASCAAEPINSRTVARFLSTFTPCGFRPEAFYPTWGLAEATLLVTGRSGATFHWLNARELEQNRIEYSFSGGPARTMVGCGKVLKEFDVDVQIVDPETRVRLPEGAIGEVWVRGELVAQGYWNRPEETAATFRAEITGGNGDYFLRTGDLGFMAGDEFVFMGRRKDIIIVEGKNHYPQDIEKTVEASHAALRPGCSIAFSVDTDEETRVVVVAELNKEYRIAAGSESASSGGCVSRREIEKAIRRDVAEEHQIRVSDIVLIATNTIPKTSSGKLQRSTCRQSFLSGSLALAKTDVALLSAQDNARNSVDGI